MKSLLHAFFFFLLVTQICLAQIKDLERSEFFNVRITHDKNTKWPQQSFYQRKLEWQWIIDSTWGPGTSTSQKQQVFDTYTNNIQQNFALFYRLNLDWDSLKTYWRIKITDSTSHGGFFQIMSHLAWSLKDEHSVAWNIEIGNTPLNPGVPLFITPCWGVLDNTHFGAALTANNSGEIFVIKTIANHPLGLVPGDIIVGYEGVKWMDIVDELMDFHIPILGTGPTNATARQHNLLISAGFNWHLFSTIDIIKHSTGDTLHLSLEPLIQIQENLINAEQIDIPGVPKPNFVNEEQSSYGIIDNSNIGYIYIYRHTTPSGLPNANIIFQQAITSLWNTDGLIIDLRFNQGGYTEINLNSGFNLLLNDTITELKHVKRCSATELNLLCDYNPTWWTTTMPDPSTFYEKPIAILVGPRCLSMGDYIAYRFKNLLNVRFFGKTSSGALGVLGGYENYLGWILNTQYEDSYHPAQPYQYLSGEYFPIDEEVWLTPNGVAIAKDDVVEKALYWINNVVYPHDVTTDQSFYLPGEDTVHIFVTIENPALHQVSGRVYIKTATGILIDSLDLLTDKGDIWIANYNSPSDEQFYSISATAFDHTDQTHRSISNTARFTTAGPIVLDSIQCTKVSLPPRSYKVKPFIRNLSDTATLMDITSELICDDQWVENVTISENIYPGILPGTTVGATGTASVQYIDSLFPGYFNFRLRIKYNGWTYWTDSIKVIVGVDEESQLATEYRLEQNYPNPFNPNTKIKYSVSQTSPVQIKVFDVLGNEIETLVNEEKPAGSYELNWKAEQLPSGVYFYQLKAGDFLETKKMILLK